jgi:uncharacterized protein (TIGR02271 family)
MIATEKLQDIVRDHREVVDTSGSKIGKVGQLYLDDQTGNPEWVTVMTGLFGMSESFVPIREATLEDDHVRVPYSKDMVKDAPRIDADAHLDERQEDELYEYYHLEGMTGERTDMRRDTDMREGSDMRRDTDDAMTRSEEELRVGKERHTTGHAHLRKYVVTENVQTTVPVSHEEVRVVHEPITDENVDEALSGPDITESEHDVTLHAETPVVEKTTKPVERVRLEKEEVTEQEPVNETVRKEKIESDVDDKRRDRGM